MALKDHLRKLALAKLLADTVKEYSDTAKADLHNEVGARMGATAALDEEGNEIATVSVVQGRYPNGTVTTGKTAWRVNDEDAWAKWVKARNPKAIVERVRESDTKALLGRMPELLEELGGEMPPGVTEAYRGDEYVLVNQSELQREYLLEAIRGGSITLPSWHAGVLDHNVVPVRDWEGNVVAEVAATPEHKRPARKRKP